MQSVSSRIWTRVAASISYDDNDYTTGTSKRYDDGDDCESRCAESVCNFKAVEMNGNVA